MWTFESGEGGSLIIAEIKRQSDRGAALISSALPESALEKAIRSHFVHHPEEEARMFVDTGPLATFAANIDLSFPMGLCDELAHQHLHRIRRIRNEFAHQTEPRTFGSQRIAGICNNFPSPQRLYGIVAWRSDGAFQSAEMNGLFKVLAKR